MVVEEEEKIEERKEKIEQQEWERVIMKRRGEGIRSVRKKRR
jgi:hypothetical protein